MFGLQFIGSGSSSEFTANETNEARFDSTFNFTSQKYCTLNGISIFKIILNMIDTLTSPSLVVFGPQTSHPTADQLECIRSTLLNNAHLQSFAAAIEDLDSFWGSLITADQNLARLPGSDALRTLRTWLDQGAFPPKSSKPLSNTVLTPLTVIIHVVEYLDSLEDQALGCSHTEVLKSVADAGIQGFCSGLLTAVAVACSSTESNFVRLASVSLRLAVVIGAYVDLDGFFRKEKEGFACLAIRWSNPEQENSIRSILKDMPEVCSRSFCVATQLTFE